MSRIVDRNNKHLIASVNVRNRVPGGEDIRIFHRNLGRIIGGGGCGVGIRIQRTINGVPNKRVFLIPLAQLERAGEFEKSVVILWMLKHYLSGSIFPLDSAEETVAVKRGQLIRGYGGHLFIKTSHFASPC